MILLIYSNILALIYFIEGDLYSQNKINLHFTTENPGLEL